MGFVFVGELVLDFLLFCFIMLEALGEEFSESPQRGSELGHTDE